MRNRGPCSRFLGVPEGDFIEMAVIGDQIAAFVLSIPERGEEWFPFCRIVRKIGMCMGVNRHEKR